MAGMENPWSWLCWFRDIGDIGDWSNWKSWCHSHDHHDPLAQLIHALLTTSSSRTGHWAQSSCSSSWGIAADGGQLGKQPESPGRFFSWHLQLDRSHIWSHHPHLLEDLEAPAGSELNLKPRVDWGRPNTGLCQMSPKGPFVPPKNHTSMMVFHPRPTHPQLGLNFNVRVRRHLAPTSYSRCWISHPGDASMDSSRPCPRQDPRDPKMNLGGQGGMANREKSVQVWSLQGSKEKFEKKTRTRMRWLTNSPTNCGCICQTQGHRDPPRKAWAPLRHLQLPQPHGPVTPGKTLLKVDMGTLLKWQEWLQNHLRSSHHELAISHGGLAGLRRWRNSCFKETTQPHILRNLDLCW